jgi:methyl-accepting chemotaxis protein
MMASLDAEIERSTEGVRGVKTRFAEVVGLLIENQSASVNQSTAAIEEMVASIDSISSVATAKKGNRTVSRNWWSRVRAICANP